MQIRSRIVAREFNSGDRPDLYAGTAPLEALKAFICIAANHCPEFSLMHLDVSRAYFHAKAQRPVLVKLPSEDCSEKDEGKIGLLRKNIVRYVRCSKQLETRLATAPRKIVVTSWEHCSRNLFHNRKRKTSGLTHGDDFVVGQVRKGVCWSSRSSWRACIQSKRASSGQVRQRVSFKALNRTVCWRERETGILCQHDPRHVDVIVESVGLENGNTVQTPIIDDVKDENPVWLDSDRAHITFGVNELCQRNARSFTTQIFQIEATRSVL